VTGRERLALGALGLVVLALAVTVGLLAQRLVVAQRSAGAAVAATRAAGELTPVLLGYDWRTLDEDTARIDAATTGPFAAQNRAIVASLVVPAALETRASSAATVERVAVLSATPERVETLVLYTQVTRREGGASGTREARGARVALAPDDEDRWLVAGFDAL